MKGIARKIDDYNLEIQELPVGKWTSEFKKFFERKFMAVEVAAQKRKDGNKGNRGKRGGRGNKKGAGNG